uniref:Secreted protein n=1 Tax=Saccharum spontaneum TaxID=62335 RepID=A0A678T530_SACSP|nr:hypothetical protein SS16G14_000010 [Saccharum spontaneum]
MALRHMATLLLGNLIICQLYEIPPCIAKKVLHPLLLCWEIWKHKNDVVFRGMPPDAARLTSACKESIKN